MLGWAEEVWDPCVNELEHAGPILGGQEPSWWWTAALAMPVYEETPVFHLSSAIRSTTRGVWTLVLASWCLEVLSSLSQMALPAW